MEEKIDNKAMLKDRLISFYNFNKTKIYIITGFLIIILILISFIKINKNNKNILISEKYIEAGIYLTSDKKEKARILYEEIILSKNKFYSVLALNTLLEKNLELNEDKILNYFLVIEEINKSQEQTDLITLKKALYLIKISNVQQGQELLKNLVDKNSKLKPIVEEIINK